MRRIFQILSVFLLVFTSCSEFLKQEPSEQISIKEQFATETGVLQAVNGMYHSLEALVSSKFYFYADLQGGNLSFTPGKFDYILEIPPGMNIEQVYEFRDQESDSDYGSFYSDCYKVINEANIIVEKAGDLSFLTENQRRQITAEALACRAFCHYILSLVYAQNYNFTPDASHPGIVYK